MGGCWSHVCGSRVGVMGDLGFLKCLTMRFQGDLGFAGVFL